MRNWLVKNFVLDYQLKLFNTIYNAPRASRIIFPLFVITGILICFNSDWPIPTIPIWICYFLDLLSLFFGFIYFHIIPVEWEELDNYQKYQYGCLKAENLTKAQLQEFLILYEYYKNI